ncbi:MAG TPA: winged helix-turn-helix transcriptional regulator [Solirubrobacterales bacterium]|nr:winged helix-turn-helix transcriptional regulator [Solirubrobacterales bacterium]
MLDAAPRSGSIQLAAPEATERDYATEYPFRSGGYVLSIFSKALHGLILRALAKGPMRLAQLRRDVGGPAQTTLRGNLETLLRMGALEKVHANGKAALVDNTLTPLGHEMLVVADAVDTWLADAPQGPLRLEGEAGKTSIKALVNGWGSTMLRALAVRPFTLTELDNLISSFSYPSLERRLAAMRLVDLITPVPNGGGGTPYAVSDWLRRAMAPLLAAMRCERRHLAEETAPLTRIDVETVLLLVLPLVSLPADAEGVSQLAVQAGNSSDGRSAGIRLSAQAGKLVGCTSKLQARPENWIRGSANHWLDALVEGRSDQLEVYGDRTLTLDMVDNLHRALFVT